MHTTFEFTKNTHGVPEKETVMMVYPKTVDIAQVMHKLGLAYCMSPEGARNCPDELTFAQFMEQITPEMLERHQIRLLWPCKNVVQMDEQPPIISRYELKERRLARSDEWTRMRKMRDIAKRFARRLETQRANGHPVISTWGTGRISSTAIAWAVRFFTDQEPDINEFFEQRLWEAQPSKCSTPKLPEVDSGTSNTNAEEPAEA